MDKPTQCTKKHPVGATSLLIVVALSLILIVIVIGLTAVSIRESRQSLNTDLSNRARAAAESTARDAAQLLNKYPDLYVPNCDGSGITGYKDPLTPSDTKDLTQPSLSTATDNTTTIACRTITSVATSHNQSVKKDESTQFFTYIPTGDPVTHFRLLWGDGNTDTQLFSGTTFPLNWPSSTPATMELTLIWWPKTGASVGTDGLPVKTVLVLPRTSNPDPSGVNAYDPTVSCSGYNGEGTFSSNRYSCEMKADLSMLGGINASTNNIVIKVKSRYKGSPIPTPIQAQFYKDSSYSAGSLVPTKSSIAVIDITAKVGDLYRRITAQKAVGGGDSIIEDVLYSKGTICKNMTVYDDFSKASDNNCGTGG